MPIVPTCHTLVHLAGEQALPVCIGAMQIRAEHHVVVASSRTKFIHKRLKDFLGPAGQVDDVLMVTNPFDPFETLAAMRARFGEAPDNLILNATGGTKPMFMGAYSYVAGDRARCFYVETSPERQLVWMGKGGFRSEPLRPAFETVSSLIQAASGRRVTGSRPAEWITQRSILTCWFWKRRTSLRSFYAQLHEFNSREFQNGLSNNGELLAFTFSYQDPAIGIEVELLATGDASVKLWDVGGARPLEASLIAPDLFLYLTGGWLEDFVWLRLVGDGDAQIRGVEAGVAIAFEPSAGLYAGQETVQDLDVVFTDGYELFLIECKAGQVRQEDLQKLENNARAYGGSLAKGVLASVQTPRAGTALRKRIEESDTLRCFSNDSINSDLPHKICLHLNQRIFSPRQAIRTDSSRT